jgi:uncharacterized protein (TIGR00661 family)
VLYGIQGTGNGHLSRAQELIPAFRQYAQVDVLISGNQSQLQTNLDFDYRLNGLTFVSGKNGGISLPSTLRNFSLKQFVKDVRTLPIENYDLIISDFEPITSWAGRIKGKKVIELSHQAAVKHHSSPKPDRFSSLGKFILNNYCPNERSYGFHFESYDPSIFTPVIRRSIREIESVSGNFNLVYLPSYGDEQILRFLRNFDSEWRVFSRFTSTARRIGNVTFHPIDQTEFIRSLAECGGVLCGAGFELPSEAIFLNKRLMVIPLSGQYEQYCNATALKKLGYSVIDDLDLIHYRLVQSWLNTKRMNGIYYPDNTDLVAQRVLGLCEPALKTSDNKEDELILASA